MRIRIQKRNNLYLEVFLMGLVIALSFLLPYMILDKGPFLFYGDYSVQQVPFYQLMHDSIRSGNIFWSWYTDLGSSFLGSYSYYNVGSPFFLLTLPLPSGWVPYTLGPLLALKIATAGLTSYAYLQRFVRTRELAVLGALLYAFSSWSIYNIFFNQFHEAMAFFPLLLIALEELMVNDRKGIFVFTVFINAFVNYFCFIEEVVFLFIYWFVRSLSGEWDLSLRKLGHIAFESLLGVGLASILFVPAILQVMGNTRTGHFLTGWNLLIYGWTQRMPDIVHSVFFPQDLPAFPNFFPDSGANWSSVSAWLPLFSMCGVIAFLSAKKGHWLKWIIITSFVFALIPGLNALFVLLVDSYYGRWFYMPILMMSLATIMALDDPEIDFVKGIRWTAVFTAAFALGIGLIPKVDDSGKITQIGLEQYPDRFWIYVGIVGGSLILTYLFYRKFGKNPVRMANYSAIAVTIVVCIFGNYFIATGKSYSYNTAWYESTGLGGAAKVAADPKIEKPYNYRVDVLDGMDNQAMFLGMPTIQAFNTIVSSSIMKFYPAIGVTRDVASRPSTTYAGIRPLLSVKYLFDPESHTSLDMPGWSAYDNVDGFKVWKNNNYIPYGFTFDDYITQKQFDDSSSKDRLLLKGLLLDATQIKKYQNILEPLNTNVAVIDYSDEAMEQDSIARRQYTCSSFKTDNFGFSASITLNRENLVFFSVPNDKGWTATVNGKPATIENVDVGFMAVLCPAGTSSIRFNYMTPGLYDGIAVTGGSVAILIAYLLLIHYGIIKTVPAKRAAARSMEDSEDGSAELPAGDEPGGPEALPPADTGGPGEPGQAGETAEADPEPPDDGTPADEKQP